MAPSNFSHRFAVLSDNELNARSVIPQESQQSIAAGMIVTRVASGNLSHRFAVPSDNELNAKFVIPQES